MFPVGTIIPYAGDLSKIPYGWHVCDGTNGTPDLSERFLEGTTTTPKTFKDAGLPNIQARFSMYDNGTFSGGFYPYNSGAVHSTDVFYASMDTIYAYSNRKSYQGILDWMNSIKSSVPDFSMFEAEQWVDFDASFSNTIYGSSETVQPKSYTVYYIMRVV